MNSIYIGHVLFIFQEDKTKCYFSFDLKKNGLFLIRHLPKKCRLIIACRANLNKKYRI